MGVLLGLLERVTKAYGVAMKSLVRNALEQRELQEAKLRHNARLVWKRKELRGAKPAATNAHRHGLAADRARYGRIVTARMQIARNPKAATYGQETARFRQLQRNAHASTDACASSSGRWHQFHSRSENVGQIEPPSCTNRTWHRVGPPTAQAAMTGSFTTIVPFSTSV